ncbi:frataxin, mitochondrial [Coffea eugenioides]|uniref:ferroxidase n=1 Tax=Coffea arabica TaxID=13443 RepID=A0A6P6XN99_COFAR|nr:frataxin, mitochondrial-like [Coffea arabica]XP_027171075.1 frataxin, mitochondrial [Coffea eugenioides]
MGSLRQLWLLRRRPFSVWKSLTSISISTKNSFLSSYLANNSLHLLKPCVLGPKPSVYSSNCRSFCSRSNSFIDKSQGPAAIDYHSMLQEDEYQKLANSTIHDLLEKLEEYGDSVDIDGYDIDYGNEVLTVKLGDLGTYVINKQTPNRQIWMSSPVSGPSRFDWDQDTQAWVYRRTEANLVDILEEELEQLCGKPINLS